MDDLLSQDEINALLSGGALGEDSGSGLSMEDSQLLDEVASIFSNAENSVFGMLSGKDVDTALESAEVLSQKDFLEKLSPYGSPRTGLFGPTPRSSGSGSRTPAG